MKKGKRKLNTTTKRIRRPVPLKVEELTEELVKKSDGTRWCCDCKHWLREFCPSEACWACMDKNNYEELI